ncbi:DUF4123 domain-containing protein [Halomonas sp. EGI 63088]|uniref:DUF4123 domain-containing protein n=1 Tax=Halomonas flagellata TaxID=2920385 RepID=A0ABS9RXR5_9GAMM|nr:DUF4123 domain-containing protein [Halomonas flagellata]MCH4564599.1 DUF4123 domain-containing protein [Halomonas flagellata]
MMELWPLTSGLSGGGWAWPVEKQVYLLLDGVRVQELPRRLYEWSEGRLEADLLYAGTPWAEVKDVSPWLVQLNGLDDPVLQAFLADGLEPEWGYLVESGASLTEVADHLRSLILVRHPLDVPMLLRLADPAVIAALLQEGSTPALVPWGPIERLVLPDAVAEAWQSWAPAADEAPPLVPAPAGYCLSEAQLQRLQACDLRRHARQLMGFVDQHCAGWLMETSRPQRHVQLLEIVREARDMGFTSPREWALLCTLMARLGITTWSDRATDIPAYRWLTAKHLSSLERLEAALKAANTHQSPVMT